MEEFRQRLADVAEQGQSMSETWWWLSFACDAGFLGVAIVRARGILGAIDEAWSRGLYQSGMVAVTPLPSSWDHPSWTNRLLSRDEAEGVPG